MSEAAPATITRLMRMAEVLSLTGIKSRSTIYELQESGDFPQAVRLTGKAVAWVESEVHSWIASRLAARPAPNSLLPTRPARLRNRSASTSQTTTRSSTGHQAASQSGATPPTSTSTATTAPPRRRGPARTRAQRQQAQGK